MHENREISCTSWSKDQDRSAKATNQKADMNVQEKSDSAVVPVNQSNNEGRPSRRLGREGRRPKRTSFNPTCARHRAGNACPKDWPVCGKQQERKQERFTALLHHLSVALLRDSFYALRRQASPEWMA